MSTYSPSLRIELITTGDQAGVWGNTTNTNLGTLVESAIAGYTSVSITSADQALTALNGAADESRNMTIALTTTTAAAFNVYAPPAEKTYIIYNTSSYAATIYNSTVLGNTTAAGTGVAIPAGKTVTVWSDGTNFVFQNNHLSSLTLASPLAAASGGTGLTALGAGVATFLGTPSSANLQAAVTDETGTGALVFATSPTLVTPALGTPTSGVMTNVTGLPLTTGVTGTLPVANGGTGVTASTGTGSVVLSNSPTLVTPALGTPSALVGTNITGTASGLSIGGNAATATNATNATNATTAASCSGNAATATTASSITANAIAQVYPVGSIYTSVASTNPNSLFGFGTWVQFAAGRMLMGDGGSFGAGTTGGSNDATLVSHNHTATSTVTDPGHFHSLDQGTALNPGAFFQPSPNLLIANAMSTKTNTTGITVSTTLTSAGTSATNANLPPYIVVYMWHRTA